MWIVYSCILPNETIRIIVLLYAGWYRKVIPCLLKNHLGNVYEPHIQNTFVRNWIKVQLKIFDCGSQNHVFIWMFGILHLISRGMLQLNSILSQSQILHYFNSRGRIYILSFDGHHYQRYIQRHFCFKSIFV